MLVNVCAFKTYATSGLHLSSDAQLTTRPFRSLCIHEEYIFGRMGEYAVVWLTRAAEEGSEPKPAAGARGSPAARCGPSLPESESSPKQPAARGGARATRCPMRGQSLSRCQSSLLAQ